MKPLTWILVSSVGVLVASRSAADEPVRLKKGDRIVFLGDSITQAGAGPKGYVSLFRNALKDLKKHNPDNKASGILTSDRVHLNEPGNRFVADVILSSLLGEKIHREKLV